MRTKKVLKRQTAGIQAAAGKLRHAVLKDKFDAPYCVVFVHGKGSKREVVPARKQPGQHSTDHHRREQQR